MMNRYTLEVDRRSRNPGNLERPKVAVVARSLLVREALVRRLTPLGVRVAAVSRFDTLVREIEGGTPALVLIDGDGWERPWDELVRELDLQTRGIQGLLLISSMSVGQALDAPALGIDAVILKPFKAEEHTARVYDLLLAERGVTPQREHPRYVPSGAQALELEVLPEGDWVVLRLPVLDLSTGGARVELPEPLAAAGLAPGTRGEVASLVVDGARASVVFRVVYRDRHTLGVAFEHVEDRSGALAETLRGFDRRAFGALVPRRPW
jgi:DNA-binding response OmpR family regulator